MNRRDLDARGRHEAYDGRKAGVRPATKAIALGAIVSGALAIVAACFDPPDKNTAQVQQGVDKCTASAGELPKPNCDDSTEQCPLPDAGVACPTDISCGSPDTCLPMGENKGKAVANLRMRKIYVISPGTLADETVRSLVINQNVNLNAKQCGENGFSSFNWLLQVDRTNNKLTTGGAPVPQSPADAFGKGFCFYNHTTNGIDVKPEQVNITFTGNTFTSDKIPRLNIPIFVNGQPDNMVVLPLFDLVISNVTLADDDDCVGSYNALAGNKSCLEAPAKCPKWKTNASLGGYIPLEEADNVSVTDLTESLCVLLSNDPGGAIPDGGSIKKCARDSNNKIIVKGDYCSTTKSAGGCADSYWLTATFAASAVNIDNENSTPGCKP